MRITSIEYAELFNTGNYTNQKVGVTVEVDPGENPQEALDRAKAWVAHFKPDSLISETAYNYAKKVATSPDNYIYSEVEKAKTTVAAYESRETEQYNF